jgi:hypothetical protein
MPTRSDKWIRPLKDNPAGKVVADDDGNRWQWDSNDETARLLNRLNNDELAIEKSDLRPLKSRGSKRQTAATTHEQIARRLKSGTRDAGGGFNPYDHSGKPRRR